MANEAFAQEAAIRRRLRRYEIANTLAILAFVVGIVALAAYMFSRSNTWQRPARSARPPAQAEVAPAPSAPPAPVQAPVIVAAPITVSAPAAAPTLKLPPLPPVAPQPRTYESPASPPAPEVRYSAPEPRIVTEAPGGEPSAMSRNSGPPARRMLVSIKCYDDFAYERQDGGRHYFSARCLSGFRKEVSCKGSACRIEY